MHMHANWRELVKPSLARRANGVRLTEKRHNGHRLFFNLDHLWQLAAG